jgi:xanthine/uracil permease
VDGPAGSWVSVFIMMAAMAAQQGQDAKEALQLLQGGLLLAGFILFLLGLTGLFYKLIPLFTPLVTNTFLFILSMQLSGVFLKGMLGLEEGAASMNYWGAIVAVAIFVFVIVLTIKGKGWARNYAVLLGIVSGWSLHALASGSAGTSVSVQPGWGIKFPELFVWGTPHLNPGMAITAALFSLILVSNLIAALSAARQVIPTSKGTNEREVYNRSSMAGGVSHGLAAAFSAIGVVPLPVTASFIRMTGQTQRKPFLLACLALTLISLVPGIVHFLALLPTTVASAISLATFVQMTGNSFQSLTRAAQSQRQLTILAIGMIVGIGFTLISASLPQGLPIVLQYVLGNGLLIATLLVMALEKLWQPVPMAA